MQKKNNLLTFTLKWMPITLPQLLGLFRAPFWERNEYLPLTISLHCTFPLYPLTTFVPLQPAIPVLAVLRVETSKCLRQQQDKKHPLARLTVCAHVEQCSYPQKWISDLSISWGSQVLYLSDLDSLIYPCTRSRSHTYFKLLDIHVTTVCAGSPLQLLYAAFVSFTVTEMSRCSQLCQESRNRFWHDCLSIRL